MISMMLNNFVGMRTKHFLFNLHGNTDLCKVLLIVYHIKKFTYFKTMVNSILIDYQLGPLLPEHKTNIELFYFI